MKVPPQSSGYSRWKITSKYTLRFRCYTITIEEFAAVALV
jgi:hypothetical protein